MITTAVEFAEVLEVLRHEGSAPWTTEVLTEADQTARLTETLCAFGNMPDGGTIVFGLDATTGFAPIGIRNLQGLGDTITTRARHHIDPPLQVRLSRVAMNDKTILLANVTGRSAYTRPHRVIATNATHVRCVAGNAVLSAPEIHQLVRAGERPRHDRVPVDSTRQHHLDPELTQRFLHAARLSSPRLHHADDTAILRMKGILEPDGERLTIAGLYALGNYPQQFLHSLTITARWHSSTAPDETERQDFDGPLPELLERAVRWVIRSIRRSKEADTSGRGFYTTPIPIHAIREVLANALVHRDLSECSWGKNVQLTLEGDRLTVASPGGLWAVSSEQLGQDCARSAVNELLYEVCRLTTASGGHSIVNAERGGLREVHRTLRSAGLQVPQYIDTGLQCVTVLGRRERPTPAEQEWLSTLAPHQPLTETQEHLLVSMSRGQKWTRDLLQETFTRRRATAFEHELQELVALGFVKKDGTGQRPAYRLANAVTRRDFGELSQIYELEFSDSAVDLVSQPDPSAPSDEKLSTADDRAQRAAASSKHGSNLWGALLAGAQDVHELAYATNLNVSQVRYAIQRLVNDGLVHRRGGQGHRQTKYFVTDI